MVLGGGEEILKPSTKKHRYGDYVRALKEHLNRISHIIRRIFMLMAFYYRQPSICNAVIVRPGGLGDARIRISLLLKLLENSKCKTPIPVMLDE